MPKVVKTAAEILGTEKVPAAPTAEPTSGETQPTTPAPVVKIAEPAAPNPTVPPAGFETPPPEPKVEENVSGLPVALPPRHDAPPAPPVAPAVPTVSAPESLMSNAAAAKAKRAARPEVTPEPAAAPAEPAAPAVAPRKVFRFVKNVHPGEVIRFADGTTLTFPGTVFTTDDPALAAKIIAVANRHHIVQ